MNIDVHKLKRQSMTTEITTLDQAELHLRRAGVVNEADFVLGVDMLEQCGYKSLSNPRLQLVRIIEDHGFKADEDYTVQRVKGSGRGRPKLVHWFSLRAANHALLAAHTDRGRDARDEAIDLKEESMNPANADPLKALQMLGTTDGKAQFLTLMLETLNTNKELESKVEAYEEFFAPGMTPHQFGRTLPGVNSMQVSNKLADLGWIRRSDRGWLTNHDVRDRLLIEESRGTADGPKSVVTLTKEGASKVFDMYSSGELPMKVGEEVDASIKFHA